MDYSIYTYLIPSDQDGLNSKSPALGKKSMIYSFLEKKNPLIRVNQRAPICYHPKPQPGWLEKRGYQIDTNEVGRMQPTFFLKIFRIELLDGIGGI